MQHNGAFTELFPFWTLNQIRRIISNLKNKGALYIGNYNQTAYDRTQWYALTEKGLAFFDSEEENAVDKTGTSICPTGKMDLTSEKNGFSPQAEPIPDIKQI